jgi:DNA polymerase-3 subunit beta
MKLSKDQIKVIKSITKIAKNSALPICDTVKIQRGTITVTDLETHCVIKFDSDIEACIDAKDFVKTIELMPEFELSSSGNSVIISHDKERIKLSSQDVKDFPDLPKDDFTKVGDITKEDFQSILIASNFVGKDPLRTVMQNVFIDSNHVAATDAHTLYWEKASGGMGCQLLLPQKTIELLNLTEWEWGFASMSKNGSNVKVSTGNMEIYFREEDNKYPNFLAVIPENFSVGLALEKKLFDETIKKALLFSNTSTKKLELCLSDKIIVQSEDVDYQREYTKEISGESMGEIKIGFNGLYMQKIIKMVKQDVVSFKMSAPNRAIIINDKFLLMPL